MIEKEQDIINLLTEIRDILQVMHLNDITTGYGFNVHNSHLYDPKNKKIIDFKGLNPEANQNQKETV